jgi:hypothetical protein
MRHSSHVARAGESTDRVHHQRSEPSAPDRQAELIARGEIPFPAELPPHELRALADDVRQLRQQRLLAFIAELIARDILHAENTRERT